MARMNQAFGGGSFRWFALSLAAAFVMVLGLCPAPALAGEVEVEPEGTGEPVVVVQSEGLEAEPESDEDIALQVQDLEQRQGPVPYMDWDIQRKQLVEKTGDEACTTYDLVVGSTGNVTWGSGWYVVEGKVNIQGNITYSGIVHLILADDAELTVTGKIHSGTNAVGLTIYGQKGGTGELNVTSSDGAALYCARGVTINGGNVTITTNSNAAGIYAYFGDVTINGGTVTASGTNGIFAGGSDEESTSEYGSVIINGGIVTATGSSESGIHIHSSSGAVTVNGGIVKASGPVGINTNFASGGVAINGGEVEATGSTAGVFTGEKVLLVGENVTSFIASSSQGAWGGTSLATLQNNVAGIGWTNVEGIEGEKTIATGSHSHDYMSACKKIQFPPIHTITVQTDPAEGGTANVTATAHFKKKEEKKEEKQEETVVVPDASVTAHVQRIGWMDSVTDGGAAGTTGKSRRMEALTLTLPEGVSGGIEYRGHVQRSGWEDSWAADGAQSGTTGKSRRMKAVQIRLTGDAEKTYDVYYRVHVQRIGWMAWAKNGEEAGTTGMSRRAEAIQVVLVKKGAPAPDATYKGVTQQYDKAFVQK